MANAKSVIEIDVLDEKFQAFQKEFEKFQNALKKLPADWNKVDKSIGEITKKQKEFNKTLKEGVGSLKEAAVQTGAIAKNLASSVVSIGKWLSLGALGGGFGFGSLAASASDYRRTAQGLGVSTGQLRAANVTFGRFITPESTLANVANMQADLSRRPFLANMGYQQNANAAENLPNLIRKSVELFKQGGGTEQWAKTMHLTDVFSMEELRRLSSISKEELEKTIESYKKAQKSLEVDDQKNRAWQDFWFKLQESGHRLETALIDKLVALAPKLEEFSTKVTDLILKFVDAFGQYLASDQFKEDAARLGELLKNLSIKIVEAADYLGLIHLTNDQKRRIADEKAESEGRSAEGKLNKSSSTTQNEKDRRAQLIDMFVARGYNREAAIGFVGGLQGENATFDPNVENKGHIGIAQWDINRRKAYERLSGDTFKGSSFYEQADFMFWELEHNEKAAGDALRRATNRKAGVEANMSYERPYDPRTQSGSYESETNRRLSIANGINITVNTQAGSDLTVTTNAMPGASR